MQIVEDISLICEICKSSLKENYDHYCIGCEKVVGQCCGRLYYCDQTRNCLCKKCLNYKCSICSKDLMENKTYMLDEDIDEKLLCGRCEFRENFAV